MQYIAMYCTRNVVPIIYWSSRVCSGERRSMVLWWKETRVMTTFFFQFISDFRLELILSMIKLKKSGSFVINLAWRSCSRKHSNIITKRPNSNTTKKQGGITQNWKAFIPTFLIQIWDLNTSILFYSKLARRIPLWSHEHILHTTWGWGCFNYICGVLQKNNNNSKKEKDKDTGQNGKMKYNNSPLLHARYLPNVYICVCVCAAGYPFVYLVCCVRVL